MAVDTINAVRVYRSIKRRVNAVIVRRTLLVNNRITVIIPDGHTDRCRVDVAVTPDEESTKTGLSNEVKDTVEDSLRVGRNDVATLAETPGNGVQDPEQCGQGTAVGEALADFGAIASSVAAGFPDELVDDIEEGDAAYDMLDTIRIVRATWTYRK